jgi:hypothetical protein
MIKCNKKSQLTVIKKEQEYLTTYLLGHETLIFFLFDTNIISFHYAI